jgi:copper transport protein
VLEDGVLGAVLEDGRGPSVALGVVGLVVAAATARRVPTVAVLASLAVVASFPLVGHTRVDDVAVAASSDAVHVAAAAVWTGGLVFLLLARRHVQEGAERAAMVGRFSNVATGSIVLVGLAGLALSWTQVRALDALTSTSYGWTLLAKVAVVAAVAAIGAHNHYRLVPAVVRNPDDAAVGRRLSRSLVAEVAGIALAVGLTAVLVDLTPARVEAGVGQIHSEILDLGDAGSVQLVVDPNRAGQNSVHLYLYGPDGRPAEPAEDVRLELRKPGDGIGPITRQPLRAGPAHVQWDGAELVSSGRWEITVVVRVDRFTEVSATADVLVG